MWLWNFIYRVMAKIYIHKSFKHNIDYAAELMTLCIKLTAEGFIRDLTLNLEP
jgi:hypothetical protein